MIKVKCQHVICTSKFTLLFYSICFALGISNLQAQSVLTTSGIKATGSNGTVDYTVGQIVYKTNTGSNGTVIQGVQQPYEVSVVTGIIEAKNIILDIIAYPNPTTDNLKLILKDFDLSNIHYQLYNINGILLQDQKVLDIETLIPMQKMQPSIYFLKVMQGNRELKTFKIIKN